jgi:hypothetical protein
MNQVPNAVALEHWAERCTPGNEQRCVRCGELISPASLAPLPPGPVHYSEGVGFYYLSALSQCEVRPCLTH